MLPSRLAPPLRQHLERVQAPAPRDLERRAGCVALPDALARKYPSAPREWAWQWVFPAQPHLHRPRDGRAGAATTSTRPCCSAASPPPCARAGALEARDLPHAAPLVRDPPARDRLRHPHHPGAARPQRRVHDDDLHARPEPRRPRRQEPAGPDLVSAPSPPARVLTPPSSPPARAAPRRASSAAASAPTRCGPTRPGSGASLLFHRRRDPEVARRRATC